MILPYGNQNRRVRLNPHADEDFWNGRAGAIIPAIEETNRRHMAFGPYAADGFFAAAEYRKFDAYWRVP